VRAGARHEHGAVGDGGFQVGDALVEEARVVSGSAQSVLEPLVVLAELANLMLERGVLGDDPLGAVAGKVLFQVPDPAEESGDGVALPGDFGVGDLQAMRSIEEIGRGKDEIQCALLVSRVTDS
jgi:hypothetical protein